MSNAILNSVTNGTEEELDCHKCHDSLWLHEVINDVFDAGLQNNKLSLLFLENTNAKMAVKSSSELINRPYFAQKSLPCGYCRLVAEDQANLI